MNRSERVFVGFGSNLGDRERSIESALQRLDGVPGVRVVRRSRILETLPLALATGGAETGEVLVGQDSYLNGVAELECALDPHALLAVLKQLEIEAGRDPSAPRDAPRPLDLDILAFGDRRIDTRDLVVPHRGLAGRAFWLDPLRELGVAPDELAELCRSPERPRRIVRAAEMSAWSAAQREGGCVVGLVATMGALHAGHLALVDAARAECDRVVVSIFVNPLQFGPNEDLERYPRPVEQDLALLTRAGVDAVFLPTVAEMQPDGFCSCIAVGAEAEGMEGAERPGHFAGVATVVARLFAITMPHLAFFGRKDAQQVAVVERMVTDLGFPVRVRPCPTVREADGLALSSRNVYLDASMRRAATVLWRALCAGRDAHRAGERDAEVIRRAMAAVLASEPSCTTDYVELRREPDLRPWPAGRPVTNARLLIAARFTHADGRVTRLLDNLEIGEGEVREY